MTQKMLNSMKKFAPQRLLTVGLTLASLLAFSSCNRGYGCPTNFDLNETVIDAVQGLLTILF